jgi:hypothetical protein
MTDQSDHVPIWDGDVCTHCGYRFDPNHLIKDQEDFSSVFFFN